MATLPRIVTYEDWLAMPVTQDGREEVVNGEIRIMPPNKLPHPDVIDNLTAAFHSQLDRRLAKCFASLFGLVIRKEPLTCRSPDIAVFLRSTMIEQDGYVHSAPQLVIEVLSPSETRKEIAAKLRDYESIGVEEVWLVSPGPPPLRFFTSKMASSAFRRFWPRASYGQNIFHPSKSISPRSGPSKFRRDSSSLTNGQRD